MAWAYLVANGRPVCACVATIPRSKTTEHTRAKATRSRWWVSSHRDRVAFARVCSGVFERGMVATHAQTGRPFATKYAQAIFGRERAVIDTAYPGDIIGCLLYTS